MALAGTTPALAGEGDEEGAAQLVRHDVSTRESLRVAPRLFEVGRVGDLRMGDAPWRVSNASPVEVHSDVAVQTIAPRERAPRVGRIDPDLLRSDIAHLFDRMRSCRVEIARAERVRPAQVMAGELELRWTITPDGTATNLTVTSRAPTDPKLLECARRDVLGWLFTRPSGGSVPVSYQFAFGH